MKSRALSSELVYQKSYSTLSSGLSRSKEASSAICSFLFSKKSWITFPSFYVMSIAGILIPLPFPSSIKITFSISSSLLSMMRTSQAPECSALRILVTNEHSPHSTITIGLGSVSGSQEPSNAFANSLHPFRFFSSIHKFPIIVWPYGTIPMLAIELFISPSED